eukprot:gene18-22356_t
MAPAARMKYNRLGDTGLLVSELSLGSWLYAIMKRAYDGGVNFFDNAEAYAGGDAERIMGDAVRIGMEEGAWDRQDLVLTTKLMFGADTKKMSIPVNRQGLSQKHRRMGLDHVDVVFCHRPDPVTPMEEV